MSPALCPPWGFMRRIPPSQEQADMHARRAELKRRTSGVPVRTIRLRDPIPSLCGRKVQDVSAESQSFSRRPVLGRRAMDPLRSVARAV